MHLSFNINIASNQIKENNIQYSRMNREKKVDEIRDQHNKNSKI